MMSTIKAPISVGELFDKITILELKQEHTQDPIKLANIQTELSELNALAKNIAGVDPEQISRLKKVNQVIWLVEDQIRIKEHNKEFDQPFIELAREVYINNDLRAVIKKEINVSTNSHIVEEKIY
jgi:hypothetical protein